MLKTEFAAVARALGDENRLAILGLLSEGEMCACKLLTQFQITQPTLSHHMKILTDCGLVTARREGKWSHYSLNGARMEECRAFLDALSDGGRERA